MYYNRTIITLANILTTHMKRTREDCIKFLITLSTCILLPFIPYVTIICARLNLPFEKEFTITLGIFLSLTLLFLALSHLRRGIVYGKTHLEPLVKEVPKQYCRKCQKPKPERAHHCRRCQSCIKKMDHHCPWIGTCVNNDNLAYFVRFTTLGCITALIQACYLCYIGIHLLKTERNVKKDPIFAFILVFSCLSVLFGFFSASFSYLNIRNVLKNITFIERSMVEDMELCGIECPKSPYDLGWYQNLTSVLGKPYFLFLFGENRGDGIHFQKTYDIDIWPPTNMSKWMGLERSV